MPYLLSFMGLLLAGVGIYLFLTHREEAPPAASLDPQVEERLVDLIDDLNAALVEVMEGIEARVEGLEARQKSVEALFFERQNRGPVSGAVSGAVPVVVPAAVPVAAATEEPELTPQAEVVIDRVSEVSRLLAQGVSELEIARRLGLGRGEVQLLISLSREGERE